MTPKPANCAVLPAYTTITAQSFTKDGLYLAVGSDQGRLAIFKVMQILEKNQPALIFQFEAASILDEGVNPSRFKGCLISGEIFDLLMFFVIPQNQLHNF